MKKCLVKRVVPRYHLMRSSAFSVEPVQVRTPQQLMQVRGRRCQLTHCHRRGSSGEFKLDPRIYYH